LARDITGGRIKGGERLELERLVKAYQGGDESTREAIELLLWDDENGGIANAVIIKICGKVEPGFIDQPMETPTAYIEPFTFNDDDLERVFKKSLDYALETWRTDGGKRFKSWFYDVFYGRLYNLKGEYIRQRHDGETLRTLKAYKERAKDFLGSPIDEKIIKQETTFNDELLEGMTDQEKNYCSLMLNCFMRHINLTDETAGKVLGVSRRQVLRYKASLKNKLESMPESWSWPEDELPDIEMFNRIKDPTPRAAAKNIKYNL
jgi:hypothetical protein